MQDLINFIIDNNLGKISEDITFKDVTTLKAGGKIRLFFKPFSIEKFIEFYQYAIIHRYKVFVIGGGSNILASDDEFKGVVVSFDELDIKYYRIGKKFNCFPQCKVSRISIDSAKMGYTKGEFLSGIPGSIGGVIFMNAGCYNKEIKDILIKCRCIDEDGKVHIYSSEELEFTYRSSLIQKKKLIVLDAWIELDIDIENNALIKIKNWMKSRNDNQPLDKHSAGCTFRNLKDMSAWKLIDQANLRGFTIGGAKVSEKHCNFIINEKNATASDLYNLVNYVKDKVFQKFNINLECEWVLVNF